MPSNSPEPSTSLNSSDFNRKRKLPENLKNKNGGTGGCVDEVTSQGIDVLKEEREAHPAAGLKHTWHGNSFQLKLLMLFLHHGTQNGWAFRLATEHTRAGKFDDLVFQYQKNKGGEIYCLFLQAKHSQNENRRIKTCHLTAKNDEDFSLRKYFVSYYQIKRDPDLGSGKLKDFMICTNIGFDFEDLNANGISLRKSKTEYDFFNFQTEKAARYKIVNVNSHSELHKILEKTSDGHTLATTLAEHLHKKEKITLATNVFKLHLHALVDEGVIDPDHDTFTANFKSNRGLSKWAKEFRVIFCTELKRIMSEEKRKSVGDIWTRIEKEKRLCLAQDFKRQLKKAKKNELPDCKVVDSKSISEFFDELVFAVDQPNEIELGREMVLRLSDVEEVNLENPELAYTSLLNKMVDWFKAKEGIWLKYKDGQAFFDSIEEEINTLMCSGLSLSFLTEIKKYGIEFATENQKLGEFLIPGSDQVEYLPALNLVAKGDTLLTTIRVHQTIQKTDKYRRKDSLIFLHLDTLLDSDIKRRVIRAFKQQLSHNLLIIVCGPDCKENLRKLKKLYDELRKSAKGRTAKKLIFVTPGLEESLVGETGKFFDDCREENDEVGFNDLTEASQKKLLEERSIIFQGSQEISFRELFEVHSCDDPGIKRSPNYEDLIDSKTLTMLIRGQKIKVGNGLEKMNELQNVYLERRMKRGDYDFGEDQLANHTETNKVVIISDDPGMGKSTLFTSLTIKIKRKRSNLWVIRINLNDVTKELDEEQERRKKKSTNTSDPDKEVNFLIDKLSKLEDPLAKKFLRTMIEVRGAAVLLFDGFDEIVPYYHHLVKDLLTGLKRSNGIKQIFISTRPIMKQFLEYNMGVSSYATVPLELSEQVDLLTRFFKAEASLIDIEDRIRKYAESLRSSIEHHSHKFLIVPLHLKMIAEIYLDNEDGTESFESCRKFLSSKNGEPFLPVKMTIVDLYRRFFVRKRRIHSEEKKKQNICNAYVRSEAEANHMTFLKKHQELALYALLQPTDLDVLLPNWKEKEMIKKCMDSGNLIEDVRTELVTHLINGRPEFAHRSFAEYSVASFLFDNIEQIHRDQEYRRIFVQRILHPPEHMTIRCFLNGMLHERPPSFNLCIEDKASLTESWKLVVRQLLPGRSHTLFLLPSPKSPVGCFMFHRGQNILHVAAEEGNVHIIKAIVSPFRPLDQSWKDIVSPAQPCISWLNWKYRTCVEVLKYYIEESVVDPKASCIVPFWKMTTVLHDAARFGDSHNVEWLIQMGADPRDEDEHGNSPIVYATKENKFEVVKWLIDHGGVKVDYEDHRGRTVLHYAAIEDKPEIFKWLVEERTADVEAKDKDGISALDLAFDGMCWKVINWTIQNLGVKYKSANSLTFADRLARICKSDEVKFAVIPNESNQRLVNKYYETTTQDNNSGLGTLETIKWFLSNDVEVYLVIENTPRSCNNKVTHEMLDVLQCVMRFHKTIVTSRCINIAVL